MRLFFAGGSRDDEEGRGVFVDTTDFSGGCEADTGERERERERRKVKRFVKYYTKDTTTTKKKLLNL